ncbi:MAG: phosphate acyltransferase PlsX [Clostridia bacterium]|nr:phosphate acyltransferase PlsX [Clostridia bacterium]
MKRILVDVMGGDNAPLELIKGAYAAKCEYDAEYILIGAEAQIREAAKEENIPLEGFSIVHAPTVITMEDDATCVVRTKTDSSMAIGLKMLASGEGDAFVSTGNTGALFTGASLIVRKVSGIRRPAIGAILPMTPPVLLIDSGANISVTPEYLEQFAIMGSAYMKKIHGVASPRVGLLNNGAEDCKGTELQIESYKLLSSNPDINFVGNIEGDRVMRDACDVLVTDGFSGNILLKTMEGMGKLTLTTLKELFMTNAETKFAALLLKKQIDSIKKSFDGTELGGAPMLGISKPVIKAHGSSKAKAFKNAIRQAIAYSDSELTSDITALAKALNERKKAQT